MRPVRLAVLAMLAPTGAAADSFYERTIAEDGDDSPILLRPSPTAD
jgi:hypothetical protein